MDLTDDGVVFASVYSMIEALEKMSNRIEKGELDFFGDGSRDIEHIIMSAGKVFYSKGRNSISISDIKFKTFEEKFNKFISDLESFADKIKENRNFIIDEIENRKSDIIEKSEYARSQFQIGREEYKEEINNFKKRERRKKFKALKAIQELEK